jgi:catalase
MLRTNEDEKARAVIGETIRGKETLRTDTGQPVVTNQLSQTAGPSGPVLLQDAYLIEKNAHFNRERIPERVVHAVGSAAYGYLEVTNPDVSKWTKMKVFSTVGKKTDLFLRFSLVVPSRGGPDLTRDTRGFAIKFYTEDGNWDLVCNNLPVFFIRDPIKFPDVIHSFKPDPYTNRQEPDNYWDFFTNTPESTHHHLMLWSDRGIPASYRTMDGFAAHAFQWVNEKDERFFVKFHFKSTLGNKWLDSREAAILGGKNPAHCHQDLYSSIERGEYPTWNLFVQVMPEADVARYKLDPFDITKVWNHSDYPMIQIAKMVLNRTPSNFFADVEQVAFDPSHMVPGIGPSPDRLLQGRLFAYGDTQRYRLGVNHAHLPINQPKGVMHAYGPTCPMNYNRDGLMNFVGPSGHMKAYEPNTFAGPVQTNVEGYRGLPCVGISGHYPAVLREVDDFKQPGDLFRLMPIDAQRRLMENIAGSLKCVSRKDIVEKVIAQWSRCDPRLGAGIRDALKAGLGEIPTATGSDVQYGKKLEVFQNWTSEDLRTHGEKAAFHQQQADITKATMYDPNAAITSRAAAAAVAAGHAVAATVHGALKGTDKS